MMKQSSLSKESPKNLDCRAFQARNDNPLPRHCEEQGDEAIQLKNNLVQKITNLMDCRVYQLATTPFCLSLRGME